MDRKDIERFWKKVDIKKPDECWLWTGSVKSNGYGQMHFQGKNKYPHRISYEISCGKIPRFPGKHGACVCHKCDNPLCVNPNHLFLGTQLDNVRDMHSKGRAKKARGNNSGRSKTTEREVIEIRGMHINTDTTQAAIGEIYGISRQAVGAIVNNQSWKHVN